MTAPKPAASLNAGLLARKGGARPAMRSQHPVQAPAAAPALHQEDDLGWNDMGHDTAPVPVVVQQQRILAKELAPPPAKAIKPVSEKHRAAFTLRLDEQRHLRLRLASAVVNRSAQQIVTDALDQFLASLPDIDALARQIKR